MRCVLARVCLNFCGATTVTMGNEGSMLDDGGGQRIEMFEPMCVWKGRLHKSKIRRNWQSRLFMLCHNAQNDDLFFVYFTDSGIARCVNASFVVVAHCAFQHAFESSV